jgi:GT2 family glycosyltransferase
VVNDGSDDGTLLKVREFAAAHPQTSVVSLNRSLGIAGARNVALSHATGEACAFLDADAFASPTWLEKLLERFADGVGCVGGPDCVPDDDPLVSRCAGYSMHSLVGSGGLRKGSTRLTRYLAAGCNMALRREAVERVGGFDDTMVPRGEEKDLQLRMWRAGYRTAYAPDAVVWHRRRSTLGRFWRQMIESGAVRVKILRRNPGVTQAAQLAPALLVGAGLLATVLAAAVPPLSGWASEASTPACSCSTACSPRSRFGTSVPSPSSR